MKDLLPVRTALISVSDKKGIAEFAGSLSRQGVRLISTGGTYKILRDAGLAVEEVATITNFPEIMDGRVKTLHPSIHGGILARRDDGGHLAAMEKHGIPEIDMVVVSLYPFEETLAAGQGYQDCIENIDIGGPAMIRAAAKNHEFVCIVTDSGDYETVLTAMVENGGAVPLALRQKLAAKAFARTSSYDAMIARWLGGQTGEALPKRFVLAGQSLQELRYGENPHQVAAFYGDGSNDPGVATAKQLQGKELSYNNINDTDAAFELVSEFETPAVAIIKHANPCGVAQHGDLFTAYESALACDSTSAFGGVVALNRPVNAALARKITEIFTEIVIAPEVDEEAQKIFAQRKNLRVLVTGKMPDPAREGLLVKSVSGGFLLQNRDNGRIAAQDLKTVTKRAPTEAELRDLLFAFRVCKHVKSNAIVYAKNGATMGIGAGQMSRVDSARIAAWKGGDNVKGSVVASDAFFPFADGLISAAEAGVTAVIQPGGSVRDDEVIAAADERNLAMVMTGMRHFRH